MRGPKSNTEMGTAVRYHLAAWNRAARSQGSITHSALTTISQCEVMADTW